MLPTKTNLSISILRKSHDKHDIVRADSSNNPKYIGAALRTSAHTARMNTNHGFHRLHQFKVYNEILSARGYTREQFINVACKVNKAKKKFEMKKAYGGKVTYDELTKIDEYVKELLSISGLPDTIYLPISVGNKKTKNYVFNKKQFFKRLYNLQHSKMTKL